MPTFKLSDAQLARANAVATNCLAFEERKGFALGAVLVQYLHFNGPAEKVIAGLGAYQNQDGGFGRGLEVDIQAPASNPFAARLAMQILYLLNPQPANTVSDHLTIWLNTHQQPDGDWHFASDVYDAPLAPWFRNWTFPSLNPACCIAGLGHDLGLLDFPVLDTTASLFAEKASVNEARTGEFYNVLPYVEYFRSIQHPDRDTYLEALAANIIETAEAGKYADAGHFFDHALGAGPDLTARVPVSLLSHMADLLLAEPSEDGGWPNPYSEDWRPLASAMAIGTIHQLSHGV